MKTKTDTGNAVSMVDVYTEFNERITEKYKIPKFKSKVCSSGWNTQAVNLKKSNSYSQRYRVPVHVIDKRDLKYLSFLCSMILCCFGIYHGNKQGSPTVI